MAVEKLAKLFSAFKPSASAKIAKAISKGKMPSIYMDHLQTIENTPVQESLTKYLSRFIQETNLKANVAKIQLDDIVFKLQHCEDPVIRSKAEELLIKAGKKQPLDAFEMVTKAELLLDSVNSATGKYTTLFDINAEYKYSSKFSKKIISDYKKDLAQAVKSGNAEKAEKIEQEFEEGYSDVYKLSKCAKRQHYEFIDDVLEQDAKYQNLKQFIELHPEDKETATYLWKKYFLSTQDTGSQRILNDIYDQFGTRVYTHFPLSKMELVRIREEFLQYQKVLGKKLKMPPLLEIRSDRDYLTLIQPTVDGYCTTNLNRIVMGKHFILNTKDAESRFLVLRHEMAHIQDKNWRSSLKFGLINKFMKKVCRPKIVKELKKGGVTNEHHINYFFENGEGIAVFTEGDMNKYSKTFKQMMTNRISGLPKEMRNLQDVSPEKCELLSRFWGRQNYKVIDQLEEILEGGISKEVADIVVQNPDYIKLIRSICKKVPKGTKLSQQDFIRTFENRIQQQFEYFAKAKETTTDCIKVSESVKNL